VCPVDGGGWSTWAAWSTCDLDCRQYRRRVCGPTGGGSSSITSSSSSATGQLICDGTDIDAMNCTRDMCTMTGEYWVRSEVTIHKCGSGHWLVQPSRRAHCRAYYTVDMLLKQWYYSDIHLSNLSLNDATCRPVRHSFTGRYDVVLTTTKERKKTETNAAQKLMLYSFLRQTELIEKASLRRINVHMVITSGLLTLFQKLTVFGWASQPQAVEVYRKNHRAHREPLWKTIPVCCRHFWLESTVRSAIVGIHWRISKSAFNTIRHHTTKLGDICQSRTRQKKLLSGRRTGFLDELRLFDDGLVDCGGRRPEMVLRSGLWCVQRSEPTGPAADMATHHRDTINKHDSKKVENTKSWRKSKLFPVATKLHKIDLFEEYFGDHHWIHFVIRICDPFGSRAHRFQDMGFWKMSATTERRKKAHNPIPVGGHWTGIHIIKYSWE